MATIVTPSVVLLRDGLRLVRNSTVKIKENFSEHNS